MNRNYLQHWKVAIALLLIAFFLSCGIFRPKPKEVFVPIEMLVVGRLPNGNWEVREGLVYSYAKALKQIKYLELRLEECERKKD